MWKTDQLCSCVHILPETFRATVKNLVPCNSELYQRVGYVLHLEHFAFIGSDELCLLDRRIFPLTSKPNYGMNVRLFSKGPYLIVDVILKRNIQSEEKFSFEKCNNGFCFCFACVASQTTLRRNLYVSVYIGANSAIRSRRHQLIKLTMPIKTPLVLLKIEKQEIPHWNVMFGDGCLEMMIEVKSYLHKISHKDQVDLNISSRVFTILSANDKFLDKLFRTQYDKLFENMKFTDVTIYVNGRIFKAHKNMLTSSSKVFAAMFGHPTKENLSNQVELYSVESRVFYEVLRFIYTGRVPLKIMKEMATKLFAVADQYLIDGLKKECEKYLIHRTSTFNCLELLSLTDHLPNSEPLKKIAIEFFRQFSDEVMTSYEWKTNERENLFWLCYIQQKLLNPDLLKNVSLEIERSVQIPRRIVLS